MGIGRDLGLQLRDWIHDGLDLSGSAALTNRLMDALGADQGLRGPLRDLAAQPLTLRALRLRGAEQQAALQTLRQLLGETYSPRVLAELLELLETATGVAAPPGAAPGRSPGRSSRRPPPPAPFRWRRLLQRHPAWEVELLAIAPGLLAGVTGALVLAWGAQELDRWTFERLGWSTGVALAAVLVLVQLLSLVPPLRGLRSPWLMDLPASADPHRIWSWISAPWIHGRTGEALVNALMLVVLLGSTPLGADTMVLRYTLTTLACLAAAVLVARRFDVHRRWGGASAAVAALIALAAGLGLLKGQELSFTTGPFTIPAWVLLAVYAGMQLSWQLPRQGAEDTSQPAERLWSSSWWWGTLAGVGWAVITRARELLGPLIEAGRGG